MEILLVECNHLLRHSILGRLAEEGYQVTTALTGTKALQLLDAPRYDTILLDASLPDITAIGVLREMRTRGIDTPVMLLSAENKISDRVHALDSGADDFLAMPFHLDELMARIRRMIRTYKRASAEEDNGIRCLADLTVDTKRQIATRGGKRIPLSAKEFAILEYLIDNQGQTLTRESIERHVSSKGIHSNDSVISVYIHYLRRKIDDGFSLKLLHTIRNAGYVLRADSPSKYLKI